MTRLPWWDWLAAIAGVSRLTVQVAALETRVAALERQGSTPRYRGVWAAGETYARDEFVTYDGSVWCSLTPENGWRPGAAGSGWQLAVKRGKDGKNGAAGARADLQVTGRAG